MRITDLLGPRRILLGTQAAGKQEALQALLDALAADGCLIAAESGLGKRRSGEPDGDEQIE